MALLSPPDCANLPQATGNEAKLEEAIATAEGLAAGYCGYSLDLASRTERKDIGVDQDTVVLRAVPIVIDGSHAFTLTTGYTSPSTLTRGTAYDVDTETGVVMRIDAATFASGKRSLCATYYGGYTVATLPAALKSALVELVGWVLGNMGNRGASQEAMDGYNVTYEELDHGIPLSIAGSLRPYKRGGLG